MTREEDVFDYVNVRDLTFLLADGQEAGLAKLRFRTMQKARDKPSVGRQDASEAYSIRGALDPQDSDGAYRLLQQALDNKPFSVYGRFKSIDNDDEAEWQLTDVLFDHVAPGRLSDWTFHAHAAKRETV